MTPPPRSGGKAAWTFIFVLAATIVSLSVFAGLRYDLTRGSEVSFVVSPWNIAVPPTFPYVAYSFCYPLFQLFTGSGLLQACAAKLRCSCGWHHLAIPCRRYSIDGETRRHFHHGYTGHELSFALRRSDRRECRWNSHGQGAPDSSLPYSISLTQLT